MAKSKAGSGGSKPGAGRTSSDGDESGRNDTAELARLHIWHIQAVRDLLFIAAVFFVIWAGYAMRAVTVPLLVALLLAYLFEPLIDWLTRQKKVHLNRPKAVGALLLTVGVAVVVVLALALPLVVTQTAQFVNDVRDGSMRQKIARIGSMVPDLHRENFEDLLEFLPGSKVPAKPRDSAVSPPSSVNPDEPTGAQVPATPAVVDEHPEGTDDPAGSTNQDEPGDQSPPGRSADVPLTEQRLREILAETESARDADFDRRVGEILRKTATPQDETTNWLGLARGGLAPATRVLGAILQLGLLAFLIPFYFFFFSVWYPDVVRFARGFVPEKNRTRTFELFGKMNNVVAGFVRGRIVISMIMGVMLAIGWWFCGVPYAIALGLIIGVFCAVPYLGGVGIPVAVGLLFFDKGLPLDDAEMVWWQIILWPTLVFAVVQVIEGYVLTPLIAGKATNLDPVTILVAVLAGGSVLGVYGMLLAIPVAACGKILATDVLLPKVRAWTKGEASDPLPIDAE